MIKWGIIGPGTIANAFANEVHNNEKGKIVIPKFWMSKNAYLYTKNEELSFQDSYEGAGYMYEIMEANECILNEKLESSIASHKFTLDLANIMDDIREKIGLVYPFE